MDKVPTWLTDTLYPPSSIPRDTDNRDYRYGGIPLYFGQGFLTIQDAIARAFVKLQSGHEMPSLFLQRLPIPSFKQPQAGLHVFVILGCAYSFVSMVIAIVTEKEKQLTEKMRIMGLTQIIQWMAWFLSSMITWSISISLIVLLMSVRRL